MTTSNEYPLMVYSEDGHALTVSDASQEQGLTGYRREPYPVHQTEAVAAAPQSSGTDDLAIKIADTVIARLIDMFDVSPKDGDDAVPDDIARPRRGRPPKIRGTEPEAPMPQAAIPSQTEA